MGTIRAKFKCVSVKKMMNWQDKTKYLYSAEFSPVTGGSDENQKFWEATPSGSLVLNSILPDAFEPGREYYLDFTPAEEA